MGFFNNPENNSLKVILIVAVLAVAGYFVYMNMNTGDEGRVLNTRGTTTVIPTSDRVSCEHANTFQTISGDCVYINASCEVKNVHTGACTENEKVPASVRTDGNPVSTAKQSCKPGDYQGANGGCFHVKADCTYTYEDKACPTDLNVTSTPASTGSPSPSL